MHHRIHPLLAQAVGAQISIDSGVLHTWNHRVVADGGYIGVYFRATLIDCDVSPYGGWSSIIDMEPRVPPEPKCIDLYCHITLLHNKSCQAGLSADAQEEVLMRILVALQLPMIIPPTGVEPVLNRGNLHRVMLHVDIDSDLSKALWRINNFISQKGKFLKERRSGFHVSMDRAAAIP